MNNILRSLIMILGLVIIVLAVGELLFRLLIALLGLLMVIYGASGRSNSFMVIINRFISQRRW